MSKKKNNKSSGDDGTVCTNRKARYEYHIEETYEAGMVLRGDEVKSLRNKQASLHEAFGRVKDNEVWLLNFQINPYPNASHIRPEPLRPKKLLLHRREINKLLGKSRETGKTIVPLKVYFTKRGTAKVLIGIGTGKREHDKRQSIMARQAKREADRAIKEHRG